MVSYKTAIVPNTISFSCRSYMVLLQVHNNIPIREAQSFPYSLNVQSKRNRGVWTHAEVFPVEPSVVFSYAQKTPERRAFGYYLWAFWLDLRLADGVDATGEVRHLVGEPHSFRASKASSTEKPFLTALKPF